MLPEILPLMKGSINIDNPKVGAKLYREKIYANESVASPWFRNPDGVGIVTNGKSSRSPHNIHCQEGPTRGYRLKGAGNVFNDT